MSDYLGQLAARSLPASAGIVPLLPTLFEKESVPAPLDPPAPPAHSPVGAPPSPDSVSTRLASIDALWPAAAPAAITRPAGDATRSILSTAPLLPETPRDHAATPAPPSAGAAVQSPTAATDDAPLRNFPPFALPPIAEPTEQISRHRSDPPVVDRRPVRPALAPEIESAAFRPRSGPASRRAAASPRPAPAAAPAPVHITIGRVEVRATVQASPHAPSAALRPARVSLDEHLAGRSGGARP